MIRNHIIVAAMLVSVMVPVSCVRPATPIAPGHYCLKEPMTGYTGTGHEFPLGDLLAAVDVSKKRGRYTAMIDVKLPDRPEILDVATNDAMVLRDGSLSFSFTDGWGNDGHARVYPNGQVELVMTKESPTLMNQIGRNYGTYSVSKFDCSEMQF